MRYIRAGVFIGYVLLIALTTTCAHAFQYNDIPYDKRQHIEAGAAIAAGITLVTQSNSAGEVMACTAGVGKEIYDLNTPGREFDLADIVYTCAIGSLVSNLGGLVIEMSHDTPVIGVSMEW